MNLKNKLDLKGEEEKISCIIEKEIYIWSFFNIVIHK